MAGNDDRWQVEKLTESNWTTWKIQIKHALIARKLWSIVNGSEKLADNASADTKNEFSDKKQKAAACLVLSISKELLHLISTCDEDPGQIWTILSNRFDRNTAANKLFLKKRLFRLQMHEGTPVQEHFRHMKELTDKLASINAIVSEDDQMVILLSSLPESYRNLSTALETRGEDLTLSMVQQALINEEMKRLEIQELTQATTSESALRAEKNWKGRRVTCFACGKEGHISRDCDSELKFSKWRRDANKHKAKTAGHDESDD
jgi:hypothetical protein